ncbi:MAG: gliding motility lipoprotein GldH [Sphingobacteriales bacterium]|nr:gliding motility lipoprotein GldH [Sphingobacteriales bacterium]
MKRIQNTGWILLFVALQQSVMSCHSIDLYEKTVVIPGHSWNSSFKPTFTFTIKDTSSPYRLYFIIRHNDRYSFNNIYINLQAKAPGEDSAQTVRYDIRLATNEKGWLASGMDDIYEHRILLTPAGQEFFFKKPGEYRFTIGQIMREDPLNHVLNTGLRIEKK